MKMAKLVDVYRPSKTLSRRQLPLVVDETLTVTEIYHSPLTPILKIAIDPCPFESASKFEKLHTELMTYKCLHFFQFVFLDGDGFKIRWISI